MFKEMRGRAKKAEKAKKNREINLKHFRFSFLERFFRFLSFCKQWKIRQAGKSEKEENLFPGRKFKFALERSETAAQEGGRNVKWHWNIRIASRDVCKGFRRFRFIIQW